VDNKKEAIYTIRTDSFMNGYASHIGEDGYCETLGKLSHEQAVERLRAQGYEAVRYLPEKEAASEALRRREQHRPVEQPKPVTALDIFCMISEIMALREHVRLSQEIEDARNGV
jgi:hypothetical protein